MSFLFRGDAEIKEEIYNWLQDDYLIDVDNYFEKEEADNRHVLISYLKNDFKYNLNEILQGKFEDLEYGECGSILKTLMVNGINHNVLFEWNEFYNAERWIPSFINLLFKEIKLFKDNGFTPQKPKKLEKNFCCICLSEDCPCDAKASCCNGYFHKECLPNYEGKCPYCRNENFSLIDLENNFEGRVLETLKNTGMFQDTVNTLRTFLENPFLHEPIICLINLLYNGLSGKEPKNLTFEEIYYLEIEDIKPIVLYALGEDERPVFQAQKFYPFNSLQFDEQDFDDVLAVSFSDMINYWFSHHIVLFPDYRNIYQEHDNIDNDLCEQVIIRNHKIIREMLDELDNWRNWKKFKYCNYDYKDVRWLKKKKKK